MISTRRLVVIAGPERTGKIPLARRFLGEDPTLVLVHRDFLRNSFEANLDEWFITLLMGDLARGILKIGRNPIICAWNMEPADRELWTSIADEFGVPLEWFDVRDPAVAALIPPMEKAA